MACVQGRIDVGQMRARTFGVSQASILTLAQQFSATKKSRMPLPEIAS
jgi:hypothetical protein